MGHKELTVYQRRLLNVIWAQADDRGRASIGQAADRRPVTLRQAQGRLFRALERRGQLRQGEGEQGERQGDLRYE